LEMYKEKFGANRLAQMLPYMEKTFAEVGLKYSLGGLTGSTMASHRLSEWAREEYGLDKQDRLMTEMFDAYFCNEKFLGDHDVLVEAATKAGLPSDKAREILEVEGNYIHEVETGVQQARQMRVSGVPFFVFHPAAKDKGQRPITLSGAQPADMFLDAIEECGIDRPGHV